MNVPPAALLSGPATAGPAGLPEEQQSPCLVVLKTRSCCAQRGQGLGLPGAIPAGAGGIGTVLGNRPRKQQPGTTAARGHRPESQEPPPRAAPCPARPGLTGLPAASASPHLGNTFHLAPDPCTPLGSTRVPSSHGHTRTLRASSPAPLASLPHFWPEASTLAAAIPRLPPGRAPFATCPLRPASPSHRPSGGRSAPHGPARQHLSGPGLPGLPRPGLRAVPS